MPAYQQEHGDRAVSLQGQPHTMPAGDTAAPSCESKLSAEAKPVAHSAFAS